MFFLLFALWIILNGQWTAEIAVTGLVLSALIWLLCWRFMDFSPRRDLEALKRSAKLFRYVGWLVCEIFRSAMAVIRFIWSPGVEPEPQLVTFVPGTKTGWGQTILANSITLTPGTITVSIRKGRFLVHGLDNSLTEGIEGNEMEQRVIDVEGVVKE